MEVSHNNTSEIMKEYNDRMHRVMFPLSEQKIPKNHDYLLTTDIKGASPDSKQEKLKKFNGRDYMNIRDIPGVNPSPNFILYKSQHKDYKLDISDIEQKPKRIISKNLSKINPLEPQYVRFTESRRHCQVIGEIENNKPKQFIAPKTRRKTNFVDDIVGARPRIPVSIPSNILESSHGRAVLQKKTQSVNPITGEDYVINTNIPPVPDIYNDKTNMSNKSRRLAKILKQFDQRFPEPTTRSRSRLQPDPNVKILQSTPLRNSEALTIENVISSRRNLMKGNERETNDEHLIYSSNEFKQPQLPALSKRKQTRQLDDASFRAYEDTLVPQSNKRDLNKHSRIANMSHIQVNKSLEPTDIIDKRSMSNSRRYD